ncbi:DEAD/DEAH box helicase [Candidatus Woesearchaeota archaeon]|nr:DEAD/DEAH box helicase [Candidatus Woesearchaeota archaeon]
MIKNFEPRLYQQTILATAVNHNTLVVLPTGLGKTNIFLMLAAHRLRQYPQSKILMLGPTRPLIDQYKEVFFKYFEIEPEKIAVFTGMVSPEKREELWKKSTIIFSTPQGLENDIIGGRMNLADVSLLGFDEAHRAVGDYSYVFIAKQYHKQAKYERILALTASPGSDLETIAEVCKNLYIEDIEVRTDEDPDVKPYVQDIQVMWVEVEFPEEFKIIKKYLTDCYQSKIKEVVNKGYLMNTQTEGLTKKGLLAIQAELHGQIASGNRDYDMLKAISLIAEALKVEHATELLETQGISPLQKYLSKLQAEARTTKVKAVQNLVKDLNFRSACIKTASLVERNIEHPKMGKLVTLVEEEIQREKEQKILIFTQFRDSAVKIKQCLDEKGISSRIFVGQMKKGETGLTQKQQIQLLDEFKQGMFSALIATSVAEEGLDIPAVDNVIFYEPIPSAIRTVQRRGRTGRQEKGKVTVLITKETRDVGYKWASHHKEKRMYRILGTLRKNIHKALGKREVEEPKEVSLAKFLDRGEQVKIYADYREKGSGVLKEMIDIGITLKLETLPSADYLLSSRVAVEVKTVEDFVSSLIDGRLLQQLKELKRNFERPLVLVEGTEDIYCVRKVHPNAIRGMLATIAVDYGIPLLYTKNFHETALILSLIAKREQDELGRDFSYHATKKPLTLKEQQEYIISSLPGIGPSLAKPLLKRFKSVKRVMNAREEELKEVELIGEKKAKAISSVIESEYIDEESMKQ